MKSWIGVLVFVTGALTSCTPGCRRSEPSILEVGPNPITQRMVEQRDRVMQIYYPQNTRSVGLKQLVEAYLTAEVLKANGHTIDDAVLEKEIERIDKSTLMPEMLTRIQAIFGKDREAYKRVFILPTYSERVIFYDFFLKNQRIQAESFTNAESFLKEAMARETEFLKLAKAQGHRTGAFTVSLYDGVEWERPEGETDRSSKGSAVSQDMPPGLSQKIVEQKERQASEEGKRWIQDVVNNLKPGQIYERVIDLGEQWQVVRYTGSVKGKEATHRFEAVFLPKADFGKWFDAEKLKVPIKVHDKETVSKIKLPGDV